MNENEMILTSRKELVALMEETVRRVLSEKNQGNEAVNSNSSLLLSLKEAAGFLKLAPQTIYGFTSKRMIPFLKRGKRLYFNRTDLQQWLEKGNKNSVTESQK